MDFIIQTVNILADLLVILIFIRVIFSWFNMNDGWLVSFVIEATNPILKPIQAAMPRTGFIDFSPMIAFVIIELARNIINMAL